MTVLLVICLVVAGVCGLVVLALRPSAPQKPLTPSERPANASPPSSPPTETYESRFRREIEVEAQRLNPLVDAEADRLMVEAMREAERVAAEDNVIADEVGEPNQAPHGIVMRRDFVPKESERRYLSRDDRGLPTIKFVDAGDRLSIWSPVEGGALINPKGPGLRHLGLYSSYARGSGYYERAYRNADLGKGAWVDLVREPDNKHDSNAVAICAPGTRLPLGFVQKGRAAAVARRMDAGEDMAGVSMRGPARGRADDTALLLIGNRNDLTAMF